MRYRFVLYSLFISIVVIGQQRPHYSQYNLNSFVLNPAIAGIENYIDLKVSNRNQWVGLNGAPSTTYITIHGPFKKDPFQRKSGLTNIEPEQGALGDPFWKNYVAAKPHHGFGFSWISDKTGALVRNQVALSYAYHLGLDPSNNISIGFSGGVQRLSLNTKEIDFGAINPVDPALLGSGYLNRFRPELSAGIWFYQSKLFGGISLQNIIPAKITYADEEVTLERGKLIPHLFFTLGYRFIPEVDLHVIPSIQVKKIYPLPLGIDVNIKAIYKQDFWLGFSYRKKYGYVGMVGLNVLKKYTIAYSYDYSTTALNTVSRGTHEFILGFTISNNNDEWCPKRNW